MKATTMVCILACCATVLAPVPAADALPDDPTEAAIVAYAVAECVHTDNEIPPHVWITCA